MKRIPLSLLCLSILLGACSSTITVKKVAPGETTPGIRFSLPSRFVMAEPQADGSLAISVVHLPDENQTFAISGHSKLAKSKLSVTVAEGLLKEVAYTSDTTAVASQAATSAGAVRAKDLEAQAKEIKSAADNEKALKEKIAAAELALGQAEEQLRLAKALLPAGDAKIFLAEVEVAKARLALEDLLEKQAELTLDTANDPTATAFGPLFYKIVEDYSDPENPTIKLEAISAQRSYPVRVTSGDSATEPECPDASLLLSLGEVKELSDGTFEVSIVVQRGFSFSQLRIEDFENAEIVDEIADDSFNESDELVLTVPAGEYQVLLEGIDGEDCEGSMSFRLAAP